MVTRFSYKGNFVENVLLLLKCVLFLVYSKVATLSTFILRPRLIRTIWPVRIKRGSTVVLWVATFRNLQLKVKLSKTDT